jgi:hypothetical protein
MEDRESKVGLSRSSAHLPSPSVFPQLSFDLISSLLLYANITNPIKSHQSPIRSALFSPEKEVKVRSLCTAMHAHDAHLQSRGRNKAGPWPNRCLQPNGGAAVEP